MDQWDMHIETVWCNQPTANPQYNNIYLITTVGTIFIIIIWPLFASYKI